MNKQKILKSGWNTINWIKINKIVFKLQQEIYTASKEGDLRKIRKLQRKLLESAAARFTAVRKITQNNRIKINASVDGVKPFYPVNRLELASSLKIPTKVSILKKVFCKPTKSRTHTAKLCLRSELQKSELRLRSMVLWGGNLSTAKVTGPTFGWPGYPIRSEAPPDKTILKPLRYAKKTLVYESKSEKFLFCKKKAKVLIRTMLSKARLGCTHFVGSFPFKKPAFGVVQTKFVQPSLDLLGMGKPKTTKLGMFEKKTLNISTIKDLCLQFLLKLALEPEWEARFEPNSYGFRPGRGAHDAIKAILNTVIKNKKYVLKATIAKCFNRIDHNAILQKLNIKGSLAKQVKYWLKAGILDGEIFMDTPKRTPEEKIIFPLLVNIALHGLEIHLKEWLASSGCEAMVDSRTGYKLAPNVIQDSLHIIRYADDFVILHKDKHIILKCKAETEKFLAGIGLELSTAKTRLTHTLELKKEDTSAEGFDGKIGFNFLGFTIKQFKTQHRSAKATKGKIVGFKTLVVPSKKSVNNHQKNLHDLILNHGKKLTQVALIKKLNPLIQNWSIYFGISDAGKTGHLNKADYWTYLKLRRWAKRMKGGSGEGSKYWKRIGTKKWSFCNGKIALVKHLAYSYPIHSYVKVFGKSSIFDKTLSLYWSKRIKIFSNFNKRIQ